MITIEMRMICHDQRSALFQRTYSQGFTLVEVVVAAALFGMVAYFVVSRRGDGAIQDQKRDQFVRMYSIKDFTYLDVAYNSNYFFPNAGFAYYACYNEEGVMLPNHVGEIDYGLVSRVAIRTTVGCMIRAKRAPEADSGSLAEQMRRCIQPRYGGKFICQDARFLTFVRPVIDQQQVMVDVVAVHSKLGTGISHLGMQGFMNSGY